MVADYVRIHSKIKEKTNVTHGELPFVDSDRSENCKTGGTKGAMEQTESILITKVPAQKCAQV